MNLNKHKIKGMSPVAHRTLWIFRAAVFLLFISSIPISSFGSDKEWEQVCNQVENMSLPAKDRPDQSAIQSLAKCQSMDLYYGFDSAADPVKARHCAYVEIDQGDDLVFGGSAILMMIYANGQGVERNLDAAIKLACGIEGAPAEVEGRVQHLISLRQQEWKGDDFSLCDDITSGFMQGQCASLDKRFDDAKRIKRFAALTSKWTEQDRKALNILVTSFDAFVAARVENEVDLSGTGRAAFQIEEETALRQDFLYSLETFEGGKLPCSAQEEYSRVDNELNAIYQKIQMNKRFSWGTVTKAEIMETQRLWLKYREAWVVFGHLKYPEISAARWNTWLTQNRTKMLKEFVDNDG